jgi:hypothetical protein
MSVYFIGELASCQRPYSKKMARRTIDAVKTRGGLRKNEERAILSCPDQEIGKLKQNTLMIGRE